MRNDSQLSLGQPLRVAPNPMPRRQLQSLTMQQVSALFDQGIYTLAWTWGFEQIPTVQVGIVLDIDHERNVIIFQRTDSHSIAHISSDDLDNQRYFLFRVQGSLNLSHGDYSELQAIGRAFVPNRVRPNTPRRVHLHSVPLHDVWEPPSEALSELAAYHLDTPLDVMFDGRIVETTLGPTVRALFEALGGVEATCESSDELLNLHIALEDASDRRQARGQAAVAASNQDSDSDVDDYDIVLADGRRVLARDVPDGARVICRCPSNGESEGAGGFGV